ncbi:MAG: glycosyltransferase family 25 protein, partial [Alphaproteobacteria bacterium]|nr:glycosyltransferase family 25 protein [Alphaproteobacteria bacterium]
MTLPVFVINPDSRPDRWAAMSAQLDRLGISAERIPAVDARLLAAQEEWEQRTNGNAPEWHVDDLGAVACALGHCRAWGALLASRHPAALVLEDDAELASDLPALLESSDWWPAGARLVRLETDRETVRLLGPERGRTPSGRNLRALAHRNAGAGGYLIRRDAVAEALAACRRSEMPVDRVLFDLRRSKTARRLRPVQAVPAMVRRRQEAFAPDTGLRRRVRRPKGSLQHTLAGLPHGFAVAASRLAGRVKRKKLRYSAAPPPAGRKARTARPV